MCWLLPTFSVLQLKEDAECPPCYEVLCKFKTARLSAHQNITFLAKWASLSRQVSG